VLNTIGMTKKYAAWTSHVCFCIKLPPPSSLSLACIHLAISAMLPPAVTRRWLPRLRSSLSAQAGGGWREAPLANYPD